ncbi:hypothetical protein [Cellulosimicrobium cellulans]|uniref:hypothetical protein n=1 Tax=Cellulosimicrobium cellulans TaxID=1710 RepID=UPI0020CE9A78|nr:hypothetical protein NMQ07_18145 [Cellulosimicrobium cellulans]
MIALIFVIGWFIGAVVAATLNVGVAAVGDAFGVSQDAIDWIAMAVQIAGPVAVIWLGFRLHRRLVQRPAYWCPRCGVQTDPRFDICRACGRVKHPS